MDHKEIYMHRCIELAMLGAGNVAPNPMVGAVLVHDDRIIGEGYHAGYGGPHAEVNCIASVKAADRPLIPASTLYVSLEPCAHFGKTPPCANLILSEKIQKVVIGSKDPFDAVNGKGIRILEQAGVQVLTGVLEDQCHALNKRFFTFHTRKRPFIVLKWAQTANGMIAGRGPERLLISNAYSNRLVHRWRSQEAAILVGTTTALADDPQLNTRLWKGKDPVRLLIDRNLKLPGTLKVLDGTIPTIVFNCLQEGEEKGIQYIRLKNDESFIDELLGSLYRLGIQSILVEGGASTIRSFIEAGLWDEARIITNTQLHIGEGLAAPVLPDAVHRETLQLENDLVQTFTHSN